ncbi:hypothetical protein BDV96DRAFT_481445 [Lophiotrema nucula]|uniref:Uncharacterized protein n=1 Tax=Lophiotrema nucula TaxID=690887 RepID=A0A6A5ZU48_9PLEO|nr:hypothetical protein BDV96DRAFT_481445 [Lophiotrema nucula]
MILSYPTCAFLRTVVFALGLSLLVRCRTLQPIRSAGRSNDREIPPIPERPDGLEGIAFHGSRFNFFDEIAHIYGFVDDGLNPAVVHSPVFLYSRTLATNDPCYPEGASNAKGDGPNPESDYSRGDPFPVYVSASWCPDDIEWRINYDVYYVHDGASCAGHKHDWEV